MPFSVCVLFCSSQAPQQLRIYLRPHEMHHMRSNVNTQPARAPSKACCWHCEECAARPPVTVSHERTSLNVPQRCQLHCTGEESFSRTAVQGSGWLLSSQLLWCLSSQVNACRLLLHCKCHICAAPVASEPTGLMYGASSLMLVLGTLRHCRQDCLLGRFRHRLSLY